MGATRQRARAGTSIAGVAVLAAALCLAAGAALAQGSIRVRLPDLSGLSKLEAKALLQQLARVNVITSNCPGWEISQGEWMLLTATGERLAAQLGLDPVDYERRYFGRAFELLSDPRNCDRVGPQARPLLNRLTALGGSTRPVAAGPSGRAAAPEDGQGTAKARGREGRGGKGDKGDDRKGGGRSGQGAEGR